MILEGHSQLPQQGRHHSDQYYVSIQEGCPACSVK